MKKDTQKKKQNAGSPAAVIIEKVTPEIDGGRFPVKGIAGRTLRIEADIFKDGHDVIAACIQYKKAGENSWQESPMSFADNDRWQGEFTPRENAAYLYTLSAWQDVTATWLKNTGKKCEAGECVQSELAEGQAHLKQMARRASPGDRRTIESWIRLLKLSRGEGKKVLAVLQAPRMAELVKKYPIKAQVSAYEKTLKLTVDRGLAIFGAWYEMFPRSQGQKENQGATFRDCIRRLPEIKKMGFDIIYLPPIHPIGTTNRKGPNNSLNAGPDAPGSPWAIGSLEGGHKAVHPELGTMKDFEDFVRAANKLDIEIALDYAIQCSPDHPYVRQHPEWFYHLPDGSIRYAENPPKKYQDIYPLDFSNPGWRGLWAELKSIVIFWIQKGVRIFRVDNPHTKPLPFWEWLISSVQKDYPEVIFLSEAFTRPKVMKFLAKAGFTQSYTYFTWRNTKWELRQYLEELTQTDMKYYFRGNFFTNTPDILHEVLQTGGRPAFKMRLVLAATLSPAYGIYSGFELCENRAKAPGSEEYLDSEKYQYKVWDWDRPGHIKGFIGKVNEIRRGNPALAGYDNLEFFQSYNNNILAYGKTSPDLANIIIVVVNMDPFHSQEDLVTLPIAKWGLQDWQTYKVRDLITGQEYDWKGPTNYVRLDPHQEPAHIFCLKK